MEFLIPWLAFGLFIGIIVTLIRHQELDKPLKLYTIGDFIVDGILFVLFPLGYIAAWAILGLYSGISWIYDVVTGISLHPKVNKIMKHQPFKKDLK